MSNNDTVIINTLADPGMCKGGAHLNVYPGSTPPDPDPVLLDH